MLKKIEKFCFILQLYLNLGSADLIKSHQKMEHVHPIKKLLHRKLYQPFFPNAFLRISEVGIQYLIEFQNSSYLANIFFRLYT